MKYYVHQQIACVSLMVLAVNILHPYLTVIIIIIIIISIITTSIDADISYLLQ